MPTLEQIKGARRLMAESEIMSIRLIEASAAYLPPDGKRLSRSRTERPSLQVQTGPPSARGIVVEPNRLRVVVKYRLRATRGGPRSRTPAIGIRATFELFYLLPSELAPTPTEISAFCKTNVLLNSWPYWREFVQSTISRMNLPPLTIPLFRFSPATRSSQGSVRIAAKRR